MSSPRRTYKSSPYSYTSPMAGRKHIPKEFKMAFGRQIYGECLCITAPARQGKTLTLVKIIVQRLLDDVEGKIQHVVSNIPLDLRPIGMQEKVVYLEDIDVLREIPPKQKVRIIGIDEMRRLTDSRCSMGQKNRLVSNLFADAYKQRTDLYYTDQDAFAVDKRVRLNVNYVIFPMFDERTGWCMNYDFRSLKAYDEFVNFGYGKPFYQWGFWAPSYYQFFDTEHHVGEFHIKFHPERFSPDFLEWRTKEAHEDRKINSSLIAYWDKTQAIGLDPSERSCLLEHLVLQGKA